MVISANVLLTGSYDYNEVGKSVLIAIAASYAALDLAGRVTAASGRARAGWLSGGAIAMGIGIWAMQFKGMLAFRLPVPVEYHWPTVLASLLLAILASAVALYVVSRQKMGRVEVLIGSVIMGGGVAGMHYIGIAAMRLPAIPRFSPVLVTLSILLAIFFSLLALLMAFDLREETRWAVWRRLGSATVMGVAVSSMHYTGMAALSFMRAAPPNLLRAVRISPLFNDGVAIVTLIVLMAASVTSSVDRQASAEVQRLNQDLEGRVAERTLQLEAFNQALKNEIAERERAEAALRESEDRLRLVIDTIPQQIWSGAADGSLDFRNTRSRSYRGLTPEELQGGGWQSVLHPDDRERVLKAWHESVVNGTPYEQEERHRGADGRYRWFLSRGELLRDSEGHIVRWYGTSTDIEDRKEAEDRLRLVIDTTPAMLYSARPDGYIDFFTKRWLDYVGLPLDEVCGWRWTDSIHPEDAEDFVGKWRSSLATGEPFEAEGRVLRADGEYRRQLHRIVPLRDKAGNIVKWYGSSIDIEDRKRAEEALQEAQNNLARVTRAVAMGELAATIAHEVNQPLAAIVTNASFCLRELAGGAQKFEKLREAIAEIVNDGTRASAVISRIREQLVKGAPEDVELGVNGVIQDVTWLLRNELTRSRVSLRTELAADLPHVFGDRVQLQQVLINLVMNGIDAMRTVADRPRELLIKSAKHADGVLVQVQDSGRGFDPEQADRIFQPFFTTKAEGVGMGLSISRSIVESHGGRLWAESSAKGALFQFTLSAQNDGVS
jgi:PAS domain S-box-containing protein